MIDAPITRYVQPDSLDQKNGKVVAEDDEFVVFYLPGRNVYIDSTMGTQWQRSEYVLLRKTKSYLNGGFAIEVLRFARGL